MYGKIFPYEGEKESIKMEQNDYKKANLETLIKWLGKRPYLNETTKRNWFEIGLLYQQNLSYLYEIYQQVITDQQSLKDDEKQLFYVYESPKHCVQYKDEQMEYTKDEMTEILKGILCILEEILPLGSVVDLNWEFLKESIEQLKQAGDDQNGNRIEEVIKSNLRFVITRRFIENEDNTTYFEYGGVPYPVGQDMQNILLFFTPKMIEKIIHPGYQEEREKAFVFLVKEELILERGKYSVGFQNSEK